MKKLIYEKVDIKKIHRRFCIFPKKCRVDAPGELYALVWWEWVEWNDVYRDWITDLPEKRSPEND